MSTEEVVVKFYDAICEYGRPGRLGKTFQTKNNYYFLDAGTGKVAQIRKSVYDILTTLLESDDATELLQLSMDSNELIQGIEEIQEAIKTEHILSANKVETLTGEAVTDLDEALDHRVQNVTLEVTEKCNLRCKYCIYNPSHPEYREFGHKDMDWETAKKAIDFLKLHSDKAEETHIGFYGGEPLMNFPLIKQATEYALNVFDGKMTFAMTTNATLVSDEIADFLMCHDFNIIVSFDGPEELHDANRIMVDGKGSYAKTVQGVKKLLEAEKRWKKESKISFNMVVSGPDYKNKYNRIQEFLDNAEWIPDNIGVLTSSVDRGPEDSEYYLPQSKEEFRYVKSAYDPLDDWDNHYRDEHAEREKSLFSDSVIDKGLSIIHQRLLSDKPVKNYGMNGCCVPGERRIYVTVSGEFLLCEKVGNIPSIGNVNEGFYKERIRKLYVDSFIQEAKKYCGECWAVNLCSMCYVNCFDRNGTHFAYRHNSCRSERIYLENNLVRYHTILEENPERLLEYNQKVFK